MSETMIIWGVVGFLIGLACSLYGVAKEWSFVKSILITCAIITLLHIIVTTIDVVINGV